MSTIEELDVKLALVYSDFNRGMEIASQGLDNFEARAKDQLSGLSISAPNVEAGGIGDQIQASILPLGERLRSSLQSAFAPATQAIQASLGRLSKQLQGQFDFEREKASVEELARFWSGSLDSMGGQVGAFRRRVQRLFGNAFLQGSLKPPKLDSLKVPNLDFSPGTSSILGFRSATNLAAKSVRGLGFEIVAALGVVGLTYKAITSAISFLKGGIKSASDLNETLSKTDVILGNASGAVKAFADEVSRRFGLVKGLVLDTASSFGGLAKSLGGLSGQNLADFSIQFTKLAADLSSIANIDMTEAADALTIGLSGNQSDLLKRFGVVTTEAAVKQYALAHGIARAGEALSEEQKFLARAGILSEGLAFANGDLERTFGGAANQARLLWGTLTNLGTTIGGTVLPVVVTGIGILTEFANTVGIAFEQNKETIMGWVENVVYAIDVASAVVTHLPDAFEVARLSVIEKLMQIEDWLGVIGPNAALVAEYIANNWTHLLTDAFNGTITGLQNLWTNFQAVGTAIGNWFADPTQGFQVDWTPLLTGFKATADKFPDLIKPSLTDMSKEIAAAAKPIGDDIARRQAAHKQPAGQQPEDKKAMGPSASATKPVEIKLASALELGTKDAYSAIAAHLSGGGVKVQDKQLRETQTSNKILGNIQKGLGKVNPPVVLNF